MKKKNTAAAICLALAILTVIAVIVSVTLHRSVPTFTSPDSTSGNVPAQTKSRSANVNIDKLAQDLSNLSKKEITADLLSNLDKEQLNSLKTAAEEGNYTDSLWHELTGYTLNSLIDKYITLASKDLGNNGKDEFTLGFTGDINFTVTGYVMTHAKNMPNGVLDCIDETFQEEMRSADIMLVNNEFPYTNRGAPTPGKKYTFHANPEYVRYMVDLGVDLVSLANNHASDYGPESFEDTVSTLKNAGIPYVGAGMNYEEASRPVTFIINGYKVGYLACCGVESPIKTPVATEDSYGILGSYDNGRGMEEAIRKAKTTCDYVIAYPHWGIESTTSLTNAQLTNSKKWIDAGADAVVGGHPHILQGFEFYRGVPVIYSLGNFWFNTRYQPTGLLKLIIGRDGMKTVFVPGMQAGSETHYMSDAASRRALYNKLEGYQPFNKVKIDDDGVITENN